MNRKTDNYSLKMKELVMIPSLIRCSFQSLLTTSVSYTPGNRMTSFFCKIRFLLIVLVDVATDAL